MSDPRDINRDIADAEALYDSDPGEEHAVSRFGTASPGIGGGIRYERPEEHAVSYDDDDDDGIRNGHDRPEEVWGER